VVFHGNPHVRFPSPEQKSGFAIALDRIGERAIGFNRLKSWLEIYCHFRSRKCGYSIIYLDLPQHSYVERIESGRYIWKHGGHIIDILAASVGIPPVLHNCELYFSAEEDAEVLTLAATLGVGTYITIEPGTNEEFFGELRAWPFARWQEIVDWVKGVYPHVTMVQLGVQGAQPLAGCVNMCGKTDFRQAAQLIGGSKLFLGTEGGLMHCANAVKTPALILWGGLTDPGFAAYPEKHKVIHHPVNCAPCGLLGHCPNSRECMLSITTSEVIAELDKMLNRLIPDLRCS